MTPSATRLHLMVLAVTLLLASPAIAKPVAPPAWPDDPAATVTYSHNDGSQTWEVRHPDGRRTEYRSWPGGARRWQFEYDAAGKEDGTCTRWGKLGFVFVDEHWEHGVRVGVWYYNNDDGTPNGRFFFEDGREVNHETYFKHEDRWIPFNGPKAFPTP